MERLAADLVDQGAPFVLAALDADEATARRVVRAFEEWCSGWTLSERADEPELRLRAAHEVHDARPQVPLFARTLAAAIVALPEDHAERDLLHARALTDRCLADARAKRDVDEELRLLAIVVEGELEPDAEPLIAYGDALAAEHPGGPANLFLGAARSHAIGRLMDAEEARDPEGVERWAAVVAERSAAYGSDDADTALALQAAGRWAEAAERWGAVVAAGDLATTLTQQWAFEQGRCLFRAELFREAAEVLADALPFAERSYVGSVRPEDVDDNGHRVSGMALYLAAARARLGDWAGTLVPSDRRHALRLRFMASLRDVPGGPAALALYREAEDAVRRDAPSAAVSALLERYRVALATADAALPRSPSVAELGSALEPDEAIAVLALHRSGMLVTVVLSGDRDAPSGGWIDEAWTRDQWLYVMADEEDEPGWVSVVNGATGGARDVDPFLAFEWLRNGADEAVGKPVGALLEAHGVGRLHIVADTLLALVPWAAVPSFEDMDVVIAPSLGHIAFGGDTSAPVPRSALFVVNPTGDAHSSDVAATMSAIVLEARGLEVELLPGAEAQEAAVLGALDGSGILHFAGHGRWNAGRGGLELYPADVDAGVFDGWVAEVSDWHEVPDEDGDADVVAERWADVDGVGRLRERRSLAGPRVDRWLEREGSTIAATYDGDELQRVAELWSAADILLGDAFRSCRLCVLTACESAVRSGDGDPAAPELPGALMFAGASTVVGTLWPIEDRLSALWTAMFYYSLCRVLTEGDGRVDVAALVRSVSDTLAGLTKEDAAARLLALADGAPDPVLRMMLQAEAHTLGEDAFAEPWHWAAFYVTGAPVVEFEAAA